MNVLQPEDPDFLRLSEGPAPLQASEPPRRVQGRSAALEASLATFAKRSVCVLGVRIRNLAYAEGLNAARLLLAEREGVLAGEAAVPGRLFFCNANTLRIAARDGAFRDALGRAELLYGDGVGVRLAAYMRGVRMRANLNGTDVVPDLLDSLAEKGKRCFLLGGSEACSEAAASHFRRRFPGVHLVGRHHGFLDDRASREVVRRIQAVRPHILLVGMGHPRQELWIDACLPQLGAALVVAVGGLFAYWGSGLRRACRLSRSLGFEWLEIMLQQPHKASRYLIGSPRFIVEAAAATVQDLQAMRAIWKGEPVS